MLTPASDLDLQLALALQADIGREEAMRRRWEHDLPAFCREALVIRVKKGGPLQPFVLNSAQLQFHEELERQLETFGRIRQIIAKARQLGFSTYITARIYHALKYRSNQRAIIMAQREDAAEGLLQMVKTFRENDPEQPQTKTDKAEALALQNGSMAEIASASNQESLKMKDEGTGRSKSYQLAHLSEVAFWSNASAHMTALLGALSDDDGTEYFIESTGNGATGMFHSMAMGARSGRGSYRLQFFPWWMHADYRSAPPEGWRPGEAVRHLGERYDLDAEQLHWAEQKNIEYALANQENWDSLTQKFRQEYPSNLDEAFRTSRKGGYIAPSVVAEARLRINPAQPDMPLILGCDFATGGGGSETDYETADTGGNASGDGDFNVFIDRRGARLGSELYERFHDRNTLSVANRLADRIDRMNPRRVFMDRGGGGAAVYDVLVSRGYGHLLELVDFGMRPVDQRKFRNKRAEMYGALREWMPTGDIPDCATLELELTAPWVFREDETGLLLAPKRDIRAKLQLSPDGADASALTFAGPIWGGPDWVGPGTVSFHGGSRGVW